MSGSASPAGDARRLAVPVGVFAVAFCVYAGSLSGGFVLDDGPLLLQSPFLRSLANLPRFFLSDYWEPSVRSGLYRPLATASYALNRALGGAAPLGYHLVNVLLHATNSVLVLLLARRLTRDERVAAAAALLFAVHAVHAEAVANVTGGRPELLAACFFLLALLAHAGREGAAPRRSRLLQAGSLSAFALALLCKESAVSLVGVVYLWDCAEARATRSARALWQVLSGRFAVYLPYAAVVVAYLGLRLLALDAGHVLPVERPVDNPLFTLPLGWRLLNAVQVDFRYLWLFLFPLHLSYDYSFAAIPLVESLRDPRAVATLLGAGATAAILAWSARRSGRLFFALGFAVVSFSVVSNLLVPIGTIMAERLLYVPSIGLCLAAALALDVLVRHATGTHRARSRVFAATLGAVLLLHGGRAVARSLDWSSEERLWLHDLEVAPGSVKVQSNAGAVLLDLGRPEQACAHFQKAIDLGASPDRYLAAPRGRVLCLLAQGRYAEAESLYREVIRYGPRNAEVEAEIGRLRALESPAGDRPR